MRLREAFDQAPHSSDKWEPYFEVYERHLSQLYRKQNLHMIEVGVQKGGSLDMWSKFWRPDAHIIGIDVDPECAKLEYDKMNIQVVIGDQGNPTFWDSFLMDRKIDVFIDDGGHYMDQQILTFEKVFPVLSVGGIYICEDCHTSYMSHNGGGLKKPGTFIEYAKDYIDVLHWNWKESYNTEFERKFKLAKDLTSVHFYDSMVVFEKFGKKDMKRVTPKAYS